MRAIRCLNILIASTVIATCLTSHLAAQDKAYQEKIDTFFKMFYEGKSVEALAFLYRDNPWVSMDSDAGRDMAKEIGALNEFVGELRNHTKLQEVVVVDRFAYVSYLAAFDRQPIRIVFEYYRPEGSWRLFGFAYDDDLDEDIEAMMERSIPVE